MKKLYIFFLLCSILTACKKDVINQTVTDPKAGLQKISEVYALGISTKVELWAEKDLTTGHNQLFVTLYDSVSNQPITKALVKILPVMDMEMNGMYMSHSTPCLQPESSEVENTLFPFAVVFTMPGNTDQSKWSFDVTIKRDGQNKIGTAKLAVAVGASSPERVKMLTTTQGEKLVVSYYFPNPPKIGINDLEVIIYRQQDKMSFLSVDNFLLVMRPEMPAMGHGSPNNINPVHTKNGYYKGKVNFTMTGDWRINLDLVNAEQKNTIFFDLSF
ncbi:FixH family protein [Pedobacter nyackensis]|uniref:YtkA-like n=1 Tax=Pedobacter nyackensis TaxID=475255 RepID=A0A1W2DX70_9SPHI|nr:FixH family protein [Pedobacter nyackensis]SMD01712.1 YtkA-like [Pedobacter nyackensis]